MLKRLAQHLIEDIIRHVSGPIGVRLRRAYYRRRFKSCGSHLTIEPGVYFESAQHISVGDWVWIDKHVVIIAGRETKAGAIKLIPNPNCGAAPGEVIIGDRCHLSINCVVQGHGGVSIGHAFTASAGSFIYSMSNAVRTLRSGPVVDAGSELDRVMSPAAIGNNVWLGLNCIMIGNTIHDDCFLKPFSVVLSDIPANSIASGNPARVDRMRYDHDAVRTLQPERGIQ